MIKITSAGANKLIRTLEDEKSYILAIENNSKTYILGEGEEAEIPQYDYEDTSKKLNEIDGKVCKIKHAINVFNSTTYLPQLNITIDTALVRMAQLNIRKSILDNMRKHLPKVRITDFMGRMNRGVEYEYVNYDLDKVNNDYKEICEQIIEIQLALDTCNQTITFEIEW